MAWKSEKGSENPEGNIILKNSGRENNFEVEKVGRDKSMVLDHVNSYHINTDFIYIDSHQYSSYESNPANFIRINYSANIFALHQILSWDKDLTEKSANTVSKRTQLAYST